VKWIIPLSTQESKKPRRSYRSQKDGGDVRSAAYHRDPLVANVDGGEMKPVGVRMRRDVHNQRNADLLPIAGSRDDRADFVPSHRETMGQRLGRQSYVNIIPQPLDGYLHSRTSELLQET
jgi:hypothetical protein